MHCHTHRTNGTLFRRITVPEGVTTDLAGNRNTGASYTYEYTPKSPSYTTVSSATNAVAGAAMGFAVAAPIAVGVSTAAAAGNALPRFLQKSAVLPLSKYYWQFVFASSI